MGTGEVGRYLGTHGSDRVAKGVFLGSLEPYLLQTDDNPDEVPQSVFDAMLAAVQADRYDFFTQFFANFFNTDEFLGNRLSQEALDTNKQIAYDASPDAGVWAQPPERLESSRLRARHGQLHHRNLAGTASQRRGARRW